MSWGEPTSEVYFMTVPFSPDLKNVIDFPNREAQVNAFLSLPDKRHFTNLNTIRLDHPLVIQGDFGYYYKYNYMMFKNPEINPDRWWFAFITDSNHSSSDGTVINFELDPWQTFQFDITYYDCFIERGIVSKESDLEDGYKYYNQSEPIQVGCSYTHYLTDFNINWTPSYIIESNTLYTGSNQYAYPGDALIRYRSGQHPTLENISTVFAYKLSKDTRQWTVDFSGLLNKYQPTEKQVEHRNDLLQIRAIPEWVYDGMVDDTIVESGDSLPEVLSTNPTVSTRSRFEINNEQLSNGYSPRNRKMYGSLCRAFMLYNENGTNIIMQPEYFDTDNPAITLSAKGIGMESIYIDSADYMLPGKNYWTMPYTLIFNIAYNSNTGLTKKLSEFNATMNVAQNILGIMTNISGGFASASSIKSAQGGIVGNMERTANSHNASTWDYQRLDNAYAASQYQYQQNSSSVGSGLLGVVQNFAGSYVSLGQSMSSMTGKNSTSVDLLSYSDERIKLNLVECNPSLRDCEIIDNYLDMYGYAINTLDEINNWTNTRSNWNYVKTVGADLKCNCATRYENIIRNMFDAGVTIWHGFEKFGIYNSKNSQGVWSDINQ